MTLTIKTAKHAIDKYGKIYDIGDEGDILDDYSMARDEAEDINKLRPDFKPCIVVTTAREALDAAWELAYETDQIPANTPHIYRTSDNVTRTSEGRTVDIYAGHGRSRLIDPPEPEPEPWESSRYCQAGNEIFKRFQGYDGVYWARPGSETRYSRAYLAGRSPKPVTIEGEDE